MIEFLYKYGIYSAFVIVMLEYACFPIPSEVVLPWVGSMVVICDYSFVYVWFVCNLAGLCGCLICYFIGSILGGKIEKKCKDKKWYINTLTYFEKKHNLAICFGRLIPIYRTYISLVSGIKKHSLIKFCLFSFIGICIWNFSLIYLGYYFYNNLDKVGDFYNNYKIICLSVISILICIFIFKKCLPKKIFKKFKSVQN